MQFICKTLWRGMVEDYEDYCLGKQQKAIEAKPILKKAWLKTQTIQIIPRALTDEIHRTNRQKME